MDLGTWWLPKRCHRKMYVAKGQPMVRVNDYVEKGMSSYQARCLQLMTKTPMPVMMRKTKRVLS